jgi:tetratricopeptide (TPR) repeat protein
MSMGTMKWLETTQRILKEHLGSDHAIVQLHRQTVSFVSAVHGAPFVPRHSAQQVLSQIVSENSSATVLLYAPAGFGKTTLLSNWALSLDCALAVHFFSRAPEFFGLASNPSFAFAHLVAQVFAIKQIWDEGRGTGDEDFKGFSEQRLTLPETQEERANLLKETVASLKVPNGEKLLILLDGIDEADEPFPSPFPDQLPEGVFVVVSARWDGQSEMPYLRGWNFDAQVELGLMDEREIVDWLKVYGNGELAGLAKDDEFVVKLKRATDGLPLFLRFVLEDLAEKVRQGEMFGEIEVPQGFSAYIREQVSRIVASSWDGIPLTDLLALLSVAKGAIRQDEVAQVLGTPSETLSHLPNIIARWLRIGKLKEGDGQIFSFVHPLLAMEFAKAMGEKAQDAEMRLMSWCERWREHKSEYALRYFDEHLKDAGEREKLWQLAMDDEWANLRAEVFPDEPELTLKTARLGLDAAVEVEDAAMMARMLLRHVKLLAGQESPTEALRRGKVERALKLAELAMERDATVGTDWHLILAWNFYRRGEIENARRALRQLLQTYRKESIVPERDLRTQILLHLSDLPEAFNVAMLTLRDQNKGNLASTWAKEGKWEKALKLARSMEHTFNRAKVLSEIAAEMVKAGIVGEAEKLFAEAEQIAMAEQEGEALVYAMEALIKAFWELGWKERAKGLVDKVIKVVRKRKAIDVAEPLSVLAETLAELGETTGAEKCLKLAEQKAKEIEDDYLRLSALGLASAVWVKLRRKDKVERNLKQILSEQTSIFAYCSAESLWRVAEEALKVGWKDWAKELVQEAIKFDQKVADEYEKAKVLLDAVKVMVKAGQLDEAKALLSEESEEWMRYIILSGIAEGLAGMRRYDEAIEIVDGVETPYPKGEILANVAEAAARLGDIERARQIFERAKQSVSRAEVLAFISEQQAEVGLVEEAVETMERYLVLEAVEHSKNRCEALARVAEVLVEAGQIEDAETIANAVKDEEWKAWVLGRLAVEFETLGQRRKAEEALRRAVKAAIMSQERDAVVNELLFRSALDLGWSEAIDIALSEVTTSVKAKFLRAGFLDEVKRLFVEFMADRGLTEKAFELAQSIVDPELQAWALVAVAKAIGKAGDKKRAEELLEWAWQIGEQSHYSCCLQCKVIKIFAQLGDWEKAMARLEKIRRCTYDCDWATEFLEEAVKQDRLDLARKVLGKRKEDEYVEVWTKFIEALAETGNEEVAKTEFEAAKKWAIRLKDRETRNKALEGLVVISARLSWVEEIEDLLEAIDDEEARKSALELAIQNCKKPEAAEYFAQRLNDPDAWCLVGEMCVETGQKEKALSAFRKALQLADRQSVTKVAEKMIEAGFFDEGVKLLEGRRLDAFTLHHVLDVLAQKAERKNFLKLLPQCRWSGNLAYRACGWLAKLYPERAKDLAHEILNA